MNKDLIFTLEVNSNSLCAGLKIVIYFVVDYFINLSQGLIEIVLFTIISGETNILDNIH